MVKWKLGSAAAVATMVMASAVAAADGKAVYTQVCAVCHATGTAGAPKTGDKAAWGSRADAGRDVLVAAVVKGKGSMPPKGGNPALSDDDAKAAVAFMLDQLK